MGAARIPTRAAKQRRSRWSIDPACRNFPLCKTGEQDGYRSSVVGLYNLGTDCWHPIAGTETRRHQLGRDAQSHGLIDAPLNATAPRCSSRVMVSSFRRLRGTAPDLSYWRARIMISAPVLGLST